MEHLELMNHCDLQVELLEGEIHSGMLRLADIDPNALTRLEQLFYRFKKQYIEHLEMIKH